MSKSQAAAVLNFSTVETGDLAMPTETAIVVAGVVLAFIVFAASLAWADYTTRGIRTPGAHYFDGPDAAK
jgi:hypothetical protein